MSKKIFCALLAFVLLIGLMPVSAIPASAASDSCGPELTWKFNSGTGVLTIAGKGDMKDYASAADVPWYKYRDSIKVVDFSSQMTALGKNAFNSADYPNLHGVNIWDIPSWCKVSFRGTNPLSFAHNLYYKGKIVTDLHIPENTLKVSANAFSGCYLRGVEIYGKNLTIGVNAFANCPNLSSVGIGEGVVRICDNAFSNNAALKSVSIPNSMVRIDGSAFSGCKNLKSVNLGSGVQHIGANAFAGIAASEIRLPESVLTLGAGAFQNCSNLERIVMSTKLSSIADNTFNGCRSLKKIFIPDSVRSIGVNAFAGCKALEAVYAANIEAWCRISFYGANPLELAHRLFVGDQIVKDLVIPDSVATIKAKAFKGCTTIETVRLPDFVHTIEKEAFAGCNNLETVYISRQDRWTELKAKGISSVGNSTLTTATPVFGDSTPGPNPSIPNAPKKKVNEKLVDMVIGLTPFMSDAVETYPGSGIYIIGYGTPANNGDKITKENARSVLREHLMAAAGHVSKTFKSRTPALKANEMEALAAYSFNCGYGWMHAGDQLYEAVMNKHGGSQMLNTFCRKNAFSSDASYVRRMCEANLYLNGKYSATAPSEYAFTKLDPNGGVSASYGKVKAYLTNETVMIDAVYAPSRQGYEFIGWYTVPQDGQGKMITTLDQTTKGRTLYAHWQKHDEGMHDDGFVFGKAVSYKLPSYVAVASSKDSTGRIKLFANPNDPSVQVSAVEANAIVEITREYRHPTTGILWVKVHDSGWMNLGNQGTSSVKAVESGVVKLDPMQRLSAYKTAGGGKLQGGLRDGDRVAVFQRTVVGDKQWGKTIFLDRNAAKTVYLEGWIDLTHVVLDGAMHEEDIPQQQDNSNSPNGKAPIAAGVVVNTDNLNVRGKPNVYGEFYCKLPRGKEVRIYDFTTTNGVQWALLNEGWACMQYIHQTDNNPSAPEEDKKPVNPGDVGTADNKIPLASGQAMSNIHLFVRKGPGPEYEKVTTLSHGNRFNIFQTKMSNGAQWGRMELGWVCMTYVRLDGDVIISGGNSDSQNAEPDKKPATLGQARVANCSTHVNVRASATPQSALQGTYALNSVIELLEHTTNNGFDWYRTPKGWVCGTYVEKMAAPDVSTPVAPIVPTPGIPSVPGAGTTGTIIGANSVNVRKGPGVYNAKISTLRSGSTVNIKGSQVVAGVTWYQIDQGWVSGEYVQVGGGAIMGGGNAPVIGGTTETVNGKYATGTIAQAGTKVRAGAGYGYKEVKTLALGDKITVYEQQLLDGVAWGRINNTDWVNLAFVTLDSTGITGTGTIGTIYRCAHAVNVRSSANVNSARMATLLFGATVEILETKDTGNESWGRTPQGWVNMYYVNLTGAIPTPPIAVPNPTPVPTPQPETNPQPEQQKPVDQGIPFNMEGHMKVRSSLRMVPGVLGDFDAYIDKGQEVKILKLQMADGKLWGLLEAGWVKIEDVKLKTFAISQKAQIVWKDASTTTAVRAINKDEPVTILGLSMDANDKVWGRIGKNEWIEMTAITQPDVHSKSFMAKGTIVNNDTAVYSTPPAAESNKNGIVLPAGKLVIIDDITRDVYGILWVHISDGWVQLCASTNDVPTYVNIHSPGFVFSDTLIGWKEADMKKADHVLNQGEKVVIDKITINNVGTVMGLDSSTGAWFEMSAISMAK